MATILPAVAVADVMITGQVNVSGTQNSPVFHLEAGSNYLNANAAGAITWTYSSAESMGTIDLEGISNQTTALVNVLDLNLSANAAPGTLTISVTSSFVAGTLMLVTTSSQSLASMPSGVDISGGSAVQVFSGPVSGGQTLYIGFYLPAGQTGGSATIDISYSSS